SNLAPRRYNWKHTGITQEQSLEERNCGALYLQIFPNEESWTESHLVLSKDLEEFLMEYFADFR
ncbi:hypothetical protein U1Q18_014190, partial [Sarracenia purpurea var. burkii]